METIDWQAALDRAVAGESYTLIVGLAAVIAAALIIAAVFASRPRPHQRKLGTSAMASSASSRRFSFDALLERNAALAVKPVRRESVRSKPRELSVYRRLGPPEANDAPGLASFRARMAERGRHGGVYR